MGTWRRSALLGAAVIILLVGTTITLANTGDNAQGVKADFPPALSITTDLNTAAVSIDAPAGELIDASTGQVLYAHRVLDHHYPASLVKLMTSLVALDQVSKGQLTLQSIIPVTPAAYQVARTPGLSVAYLDPSEQITLSKMLEYMYVVSADDAAVAVGDAIGGTESGAATLMNARARSLGMFNTHYTNTSGLQDPEEYTTAQDLGILARYLISHYPIVLKYASERGMYIHPGQYGPTYDQLLGQYPGLDGLKTGSTDQAGYCFVGTAKRGNTRLISVVLDTPSFDDVFQNTTALLDFGFGSFHRVLFQSGGQALNKEVSVTDGANAYVSVAPKEDVYVQITNGKKANITYSLSVASVSAPVKAGQQIGVENVIVNGQVVEQVPVYALADDPQAGVVQKLWGSIMGAAHQGARRLVDFVGERFKRLL